MSRIVPPRLPFSSSRPKLCGCFSVDTALRRRYLRLLDCEVHTTILSGTSRTVLKQKFTNPLSSKKHVEFMFEFPLYDGSSVVAFTCKVGAKSAIYGLVKEKATAEANFDRAVAKGDNAGLLAQDLPASDVFSTRIGNIHAGESVSIEITYIGELKYDTDIEGIRFRIPTMVASSYVYTNSIRPPAGSPGAVIPPLDHHPNGGIRISVDIVLPNGIHIQGVESPSHPIAVSIGSTVAAKAEPATNKASATLSLVTEVLMEDFVLIIHFKESRVPRALLETHPTIPNHRALIVTLPAPKTSFSSSSPSEIVLIVDRSASMRRDTPMLVSALKVLLKSMPTSVMFNICSFRTENTFLWPRSKNYNQRTLQEATQYLSTFEANCGRTEIFKAIRATIERRYFDVPLDIILFTDGNITDQGSLFTYINEQVENARNAANQESLLTSSNEQVEETTQGSIRVFTLGIGSKVSHALIEGIARAGKGICIDVQDGGRLEKCVTRILRAALSPHYNDRILEVRYGRDDDDFEMIDRVMDGIETLSFSENEEPANSSSNPMDRSLREVYDFPQIIQAPHKIPSRFATTTTLYLLIGPKTIQTNPTSIILRSPSLYSPPTLVIPIEVLAERGSTIHELAARKTAQELEESRGWMFDGANRLIEADHLAEREAVRLGETFQVVNKWCTFIAVSDDGNDMFVPNTTVQSDRQTNTPYGSKLRQPLVPGPLVENPFRKAFERAPAMARIRFHERRGAVRKDVKSGIVTQSLVMATVTPPQGAPLNNILTKVLALIDLQGFDGAWSIDSEKLLLDILQFDIPEPPPLDGVSEQAWVTMLVVTFLAKRMPEEEGVWGMIVEKARELVRRLVNTEETLHLLEDMAEAVVEKGRVLL